MIFKLLTKFKLMFSEGKGISNFDAAPYFCVFTYIHFFMVWTIQKQPRQMIEAFEMWCYKILKTKAVHMVQNENVFQQV